MPLMAKSHQATEGAQTIGPGPTKCTCARLRRTTRRITQIYDHALKDTGLKITQYSILAGVARWQPVSISELAARIALDRTTLTRNLKPLQRDMLVRVADGADGRSRSIEITESGQARLDAAKGSWRDAQDTFQRTLGDDDTQALHALLDRAFDAMTGAEHE
jgi:DNA-binding MarR family transcriptional regulator